MLKSAVLAIFLSAEFLYTMAASTAVCGPSPEKGWGQFLDDTHCFCFWYPPSYKRAATVHEYGFSKDGLLLATLSSSVQREAFSSDREPAVVQVGLLSGAFDLQKLIREAPTGYDTPPAPQRFGANVFYYYGRGGGGVAYPDMYYFNLNGRALRIVFDGPYRGGSNSPTEQIQAVEKGILSSFRARLR
jgi:hypothetical protein